MAPQRNNHRHLNLSTMNAITVFTKPQNCYLGQNRKAVIQSVMTSAILKTLGPFMHSVSGIKARKEKKRKRKKKSISRRHRTWISSHAHIFETCMRGHMGIDNTQIMMLVHRSWSYKFSWAKSWMAAWLCNWGLYHTLIKDNLPWVMLTKADTHFPVPWQRPLHWTSC